MTSSDSKPAETLSPATYPRGRIPTLDGLRGCAVLLILIHHYVALSPLLAAPPGSARSYVRAALGLTFTGVDLFFVLSGFLIGGILLDHRVSPRFLRAFYGRRALRILPLAWLNIGVILFLYSRGMFHGEDGPAPAWVYFGFLANFHFAQHGGWTFGPLVPHWSLAIEEQFYLAFPFVVRAWPKCRLGWLGPILIATALVVRFVWWAANPENLFPLHVLPFSRLDTLAAGFTCAWLVRTRDWPPWHANHRRALWIALLVSATGPAVMLKMHAGEGHPILATWGYTSIAVFYAIVLLLVAQPAEPWVRAFFAARVLGLYGRYSYFIYLFQGLLATGLVSLLFHGRWRAAAPLSPWEIAAVPLVLLLPAALSWRWLESPLLKLGHRLRYG